MHSEPSCSTWEFGFHQLNAGDGAERLSDIVCPCDGVPGKISSKVSCAFNCDPQTAACPGYCKGPNMFQSIITSYSDMRDVRVLIDGAPGFPVEGWRFADGLM